MEENITIVKAGACVNDDVVYENTRIESARSDDQTEVIYENVQVNANDSSNMELTCVINSTIHVSENNETDEIPLRERLRSQTQKNSLSEIFYKSLKIVSL